MKTLEQARKYWERDGDIVGHWSFPQQHIHVTIIGKEYGHGRGYRLIRYFPIGANLSGEGGTWQTSCDLDMVSACEVFKRLAYLTGGVMLEGDGI